MLVTGSLPLPFPFITKEGSLTTFKTITADEFNQDFNYGDILKGSYYPLISTVSSYFFKNGNIMPDGSRKTRLLSLKNTFNFYSTLSKHYVFSSSLGDKETQDLRLISIPAILYGQQLKKGSVSCKWYHSGSLIAELRDQNKNGELIQVGPEGSNGLGNVAGVVLYNEGIITLTGSWSLHTTYTDVFNIYESATNVSPAWIYFMTTGSNGDNTVVSSSFILDFDGTEKIPTLTMLATADKGEFNHSNNPTYIQHDSGQRYSTGESIYVENNDLKIKNIVNTNYDEEDPPFDKITYISKVAIYDKEKNLIGVAKLANPIRKKQNDNITIKMKLDM